MSQSSNVEKVQSLYAEFGRGNVAAVLEGLGPDLVWTNPGPADFPYFGTHRGGHEIADHVFRFIGENLDIRVFDVMEIVASGDHVVAIIRQEAVVRGTGRSFAQTCAHFWAFRDGRPVRFHDFQDTHALVAALRGREP